MLQQLYAEDQSIIRNLASRDDEHLTKHFSLHASEFNKSVEIADGIYVWTNNDTQSKVFVLLRLFNLYGVEPAQLSFSLLDAKNDAIREAGTKAALYRNYWTLALPYIKEAHGEAGTFMNNNPSSGNWVSGYIGLSGFNITCLVNNTSARVELYLGHSEKEVNKKAFDHLLQYKEEIEQALCVDLEWSRDDEIKSSKLAYRLTRVSVANKIDWHLMAVFQAEWSKQFFDVIVPYLKYEK